MFKIGDFSRLSHVTVKALRYYDEIGLLRPVDVDRFTGYRYYSVDQLPRLNRILALKEMDLSLDQIARLLDGDLPAAEIRGMLRLKQTEIQQRVEEEQGRLVRVEARLRQIEQEGKMPGYEVVLKKVEPQTVAAVREVIPTYGELGRLFGELFGHLMPRGARLAGPPIAIYHDLEFRERDADVEVAVPLSDLVVEGGRIKVKELPGLEAVASVIHLGPYEAFDQSYSAVMSWIEANGYHVVGPNREVYLKGPGDPGGPEGYVTEIQVPVAK
jgi:effector-binding domain-containing protein